MISDLLKFHLIIWVKLSLKLKFKGYLALFMQIILGSSELFFAYIIIAILNFITGANQSLIFLNTVNLNFLLIYLILIIIFITTLRIIISKLISSFSFEACTQISNKFYDLVLNLDFQHIESINSSQYISTIADRIRVTSIFYKNINDIISSSVIFCFLFFSSFVFFNVSIINMIIFLLLILFFSYMINILLKKKINFLSLKLSEESSNLHKILSYTNKFMREIILNNYSHIFKKNFYIISSNIFNSEGKISFLNTLPRYLLELTVMIIGALLMLLFSTNKDFLFNVGFIFFLFLRLFPHLNVINTSISNVRGNIGYINFVTSLFNSFITKQILLSEQQIETFKKKFFSLKIDNLNFFYNKNLILKKINFQIKNNQLLAITGASGSGKTTLLNIICGFLEPEKANIIYNDNKIVSLKNSFWQHKIAYVSQSIPVFDESLIYNITLDQNFNFEKNKDKFNEVLDLALIDWITKDDQLYIKVGEDGRKLSGGQKQRLALARALYLENKEILVFDEITSALDFANEKILVNKFKLLKNKYTIISVTHRKAILEIADNILNLD